MTKTRSARSPKPVNTVSEAVTVTRGDHLLGLYATDDERLQLAVPFILDGLREGSVCFLIGPDSSRKAIVASLKERRPELDTEIAGGRFIAAEHQSTPGDQYAFLESGMSIAKQAGLHSFRLFVDMIGAREHMSIEQIAELEGGCDSVIVHNHRMAAMCVYDVRGFSGLEVLAALRAHRGSVSYAYGETRERATK